MLFLASEDLRAQVESKCSFESYAIGTKLEVFTRSDKAEVFGSQVIVKYQVYIGTDLRMPETVQIKTT